MTEVQQHNATKNKAVLQKTNKSYNWRNLIKTRLRVLFVRNSSKNMHIPLALSLMTFTFSCAQVPPPDNINALEPQLQEAQFIVSQTIDILKDNEGWLEVGSQGELITSGGRRIPPNGIVHIIKSGDTLNLIRNLNISDVYARIKNGRISYPNKNKTTNEEYTLAPILWPRLDKNKNIILPEEYTCIWNQDAAKAHSKREKLQTDVWLYQNAALEIIRPPSDIETFPNPIWVEQGGDQLRFVMDGHGKSGEYAIVNPDRKIVYGGLAPNSLTSNTNLYNIVDMDGKAIPPPPGFRLPPDLVCELVIVYPNGMIEVPVTYTQ